MIRCKELYSSSEVTNFCNKIGRDRVISIVWRGSSMNLYEVYYEHNF